MHFKYESQQGCTVTLILDMITVDYANWLNNRGELLAESIQ